MRDASGQVHAAASAILERGHAMIRADAGTLGALDEVFDRADAFFALESEEKRRFGRGDLLEGYRSSGAEHSGPLDRPDLNESYALLLRNIARADLAPWAAANPLHHALRAVAPRYAALVEAILEGIRLSLNPHGDPVALAGFSYLQLNHYCPAQEQRDFLQDAHEDGHLLTLVTSRQPGLEAEIDGRFVPINFARDEILAMPGSILSLMTGGRVAPLVHRVRNHQDVAQRSSLMFFVNAPVTDAPRAWIAARDGSLPDIGRATAESSKVFGLPSIETLAG